MFHQYIHERGGFLKMSLHALWRNFLARQGELAHLHGVNDVVLKRKHVSLAVFNMRLPTFSRGFHDKFYELPPFIRPLV